MKKSDSEIGKIAEQSKKRVQENFTSESFKRELVNILNDMWKVL